MSDNPYTPKFFAVVVAGITLGFALLYAGMKLVDWIAKSL